MNASGAAWSAVFVGAALLCAVSLVRHGRAHAAGAAAEANHVVMALAMAVMAAPAGMTLVPPALGAGAFAVLGAAWLGRLLLAGRRGEPLGSPIGHVRCSAHPTHLFLVNAAMVAMYLPMLGTGAHASGGHGEHAGHGGGEGLALGLLGVGLAVYLLVHAGATVTAMAARSRRAPAPGPAAEEPPPTPAAPAGVATLTARGTRVSTRVSTGVGALAAPRVQLVCQAVMGVGMAVMLLWMH